MAAKKGRNRQKAQESAEDAIVEAVKEQAESPQTPYNPNEQLQWKPNDKITITGMEFYTFQRFAEFFEPLSQAKNMVLARMVQEGIAKRVVPEAQQAAEAPQSENTMKIVKK